MRKKTKTATAEAVAESIVANGIEFTRSVAIGE